MDVKSYLVKVEEVIKNGKYKDNWESLSNYPAPKWLANGKFGIFIHWGVYSVPAFDSEWYPREMYRKGSKSYEHHVKTYGNQKDFGYKDFIPMFKAEKFDPEKWADLFEKSGAKYVMPVAEHHDGFQMYDSELSKWNSVKMGPKRDILKELKTEFEKRNLTFCASSHRAENYWFFNEGRKIESDVTNPEFSGLYNVAMPDIHGPLSNTHDINTIPASKEHLDNWLARTCELVDKYQPKAVWFDWWIQNLSYKPYLKKFAAYYYNKAIEWGVEVCINYKYDAYAYSTAVFDIERGQLSGTRPLLWQNDTAIAKNSWGYTENNDFKNPVEIICDLVDIVSKNGCLLLNVGPKSDGTITHEDENVLLSIGRWLKINGEGIYGTTFWQVFGEGPTKIEEGAFTDQNRTKFTSEDIRFTYKNGYIYAFVMDWPSDGKTLIKSLSEDIDSETGAKTGNKYFNGNIKNVSVVGYDNKVAYARGENGLALNVEGISSEYPVCFKIKID